MFRRDPFAKARKISPPKVERRPVTVTQHGETRTDDYAWLRDENWREVLHDPSLLRADIRAMLEAENAYYAQVTENLAPLREKLFAEMRGKIKEDDSSVPLPHGPWKYWREYREGGEYPVYKRAPRTGGETETLLDGDIERGDSVFFNIGDVSHSPDHKLLAYALDRVGSENYAIRVRDLETGEDLPEAIELASGEGAVWAADSSGFFYVERDAHQRPKRVKYHKLRTAPAGDRIVYEEPDDGFFLHIGKTLSGDYVLISCGDHTTSEVRTVPARAPESEPLLIAPREQGVEYSVDHRGDEFIILTNADGAVDFKIVAAPAASPKRERWRDLVPHVAGNHILYVIVFADYMVRLERRDALPHIVVTDKSGKSHEITFDEPAFELHLIEGYEFDTGVIRYIYDSPSTPAETYDYDMAARTRVLLKTQEVPSGHDKSRYVVERLDIPAADGALIPVTLLHRRETPIKGGAPVLLYGYGSYGLTIPADFFTSVLPLVDRGMSYAIVHMRGGSARGRQWYLDGKMEKKQNTFDDFIAAAEGLIERHYTKAGKIVIYGGSAGGLLVGASVNQRPDLFAGVLAAVPFVDVLNTVSDETLPLTPPEWNEWGDPIRSKEQYGWIRAYSPYENIRAKSYPPIMATGGLADYRVTYWEPAKWIARLRAVAKGGPFVLRMNMEAGHGGAAARFERLDERAHLYSFALKCVGLEDAEPL
ncbi:MAG: S9 family peptidase [Pseudomonadota bacterium]|nr:S9 family peptidase [Pseudomonadota bacterium]